MVSRFMKYKFSINLKIKKLKKVNKQNFSELKKEYRDCIKKKWRQDWDINATLFRVWSYVCISTRKYAVPEFVIKALRCHAVV